MPRERDDEALSCEDLRRAADNQAHLVALGLIKAEDVKVPDRNDWPLRDEAPAELAFTWDKFVASMPDE